MQGIEPREEATAVLPLVEPWPLPHQPLVSVVLSNHNYAHYIGASIESVLTQTWPHLELIIYDDGSTDHSISVIEPYLKDPRVRLLQHANGGQATGFNQGYRQSRGDIISFLDADDIYLPTKLQLIVECALANPDCGCVLNGWLRADKDLVPQGRWPLLATLPEGWRGDEVLRAGGVLANVPSTPGLNLRRQTAEAIFPLPVRDPLNGFPDMVMMRLVPLVCRLASINEPLAVVRLHGSNIYQRSRVTSESIRKELGICEELWKEQRRLLKQIDGSLPAMLAPLDASSLVLRQKYIYSRLSRSPNQGLDHRKLLAAMLTEGAHLWERLFWRGVPLIPRGLFDRFINLVLTQSRFKQNVMGFKTLLTRLKALAAAARVSHIQRRKYADRPTPQHRNAGI